MPQRPRHEAAPLDRRRAGWRFGVWRAALSALGALALLSPNVARAQQLPVRVVPADDAALASMFLIGGGRQAPVILFAPGDADALRRYIVQSERPVECFVRAATSAAQRTLLEATAGTTCTTIDNLATLAWQLWPGAKAVVAAPSASYESLLQGAALAAAAGAALLPVNGDAAALAAQLSTHGVDTVYQLRGAALPPPAGARVVALDSADAVAREALRLLGEPRPTLLVVANPKDRLGLFSPSSLSLLAPLVAAAHHAPLVLVADAAADAVEAEVYRFIAAHQLAPTAIYLVGDELALRSHRVPDPVLQAGGKEALGGARDVRVELFSELQQMRPQDYAVGRFVAEDAALGSTTLARQLTVGLGAAKRVVLLSNADQQFALGETISRTTASEMRNAGIKVRARYGDEVTPAAIQEALERANVLLWEGHARDLTLEERGGVPAQRTPPLVILQGCYTLDRSDPFILLEAVPGHRRDLGGDHSASGSAFAPPCDALVYDGADLGTAVRNARNYLLALTELKQRRKHDDWPKTYRAALAFALWGDPTARPDLAVQTPKIAPAEWRLNGAALDLSIPKRRLDEASVGRYTAEPVPRAMLSGLILRDGNQRQRTIKELFFAVTQAPEQTTAACAPTADWDVVSLYAPRTRTLSVLARPSGPGNPSGDFRLPLANGAAACRPVP
jgi:hypothetical protein